MMITSEELRRKLVYEPETGEWTWIDSRRDGFNGRPAGWYDHYGYRRIKIDGRTHIASRLAFLYMTGQWPQDEVDHIDRDPGNDRWENLREADRSLNNLNRDYTGVSGQKGVYRHSQNDRWVAQWNNVYIGSYKTVEEAVAARDAFIAANEGPVADERSAS
jgi:hypothetical protein